MVVGKNSLFPYYIEQEYTSNLHKASVHSMCFTESQLFIKPKLCKGIVIIINVSYDQTHKFIHVPISVIA
jgi:hypothetical protein